jgi:acyl-CoA thioesterase FadM
VAFPARAISVAYLRPALVGDILEVGSWIEELGATGLEARAIVAGASDRTARAVATLRPGPGHIPGARVLHGQTPFTTYRR